MDTRLSKNSKKKDNGGAEQDLDGSKTSNEAAVQLWEMPDGSLQIFPYVDDSSIEEENIVIIDLDEQMRKNTNFIEEKAIQMILISYYMNGAPGLEIVSKRPIVPAIISQIMRTEEKLLFNWNTSKISSRKVLIKNVFQEKADNIFEEQLPQFLRDMFSILIDMIEQILQSIETADYSELVNFPDMDSKIDRYYFFTVRQIRTIVEKSRITKPLNYSFKKLVDLRSIAKLIEDVGDMLKEIATTLVEISGFLEEINLNDYLINYFTILKDIYNKLADELRVSVQERAPSIGMNPDVMQLIQNFRVHGKELRSDWLTLASKTPLKIDTFSFLDYYKGAGLIKNLEDIYSKIFDFTNLFF